MKKLFVITALTLCLSNQYVSAFNLRVVKPRDLLEQRDANQHVEESTKKVEFKKANNVNVSNEPLVSLERTRDIIEQCLTMSAAEGELLSLYDVVDRAMCHTRSVRDIWLRLKQSEINRDNSFSGYYPTISLTTSYAKTRANQHYTVDERAQNDNLNGRKGAVNNILELQWLLFDFGKREAGVSQAKNEYLLARMQARSDLQNIILDTAQKYFTVVATQAYLKAALNNEQMAKRSYEISRGKQLGGVGVLADELQARNSAISYEYQRINAESSLKRATGELALLIGYPVDKNFALPVNLLTIPDAFTMENVDLLLDQALVQHPAILAARHSVVVSQEALHVSERNMMPMVYLSANISKENLSSRKNNNPQNPVYGYDRLDNASVAVNMRIPIFNGFNSYNQVRSARTGVEIAKNTFEQREKEVSLAVWQSYQRLDAATKGMSTAQLLLNNARQAHSIAEGRYQSGVGSILELLNTQSNLSQAEISSVDAATEWHQSRLSLAASIGLLDLSVLKTPQ